MGRGPVPRGAGHTPPVPEAAPPRWPVNPPAPMHGASLGLFGPAPAARRVRRILALAGLPLIPGWPVATGGPVRQVAVWGAGATAARGAALAARHGAGLVRIEDAFLRSVRPGRTGDPPIGLLIDRTGVHFDATSPGDLETLLAEHPLDDAELIRRAREGIARLRAADLSKYSDHDPGLDPPAPGYVLVIDQVRGDASTLAGHGRDPAGRAAAAAAVRGMLAAARAAHPGMRIVIKTHPEARAGLRPGHFGPADADAGVTLLDAPVSPVALLEGAVAVHVHSSQMGFEAILAGHRPHVHGAPFYAGWGLSHDHGPALPRRGRRLSAVQVFAAAMLLAPVWYDPCRDRLCDFETALDQIEAEARVWRADRAGHVAVGMRAWKRPTLQGFFGRHRRLRFAPATRAPALATREGRGVLVWAGAETPTLRAEAGATGLPLVRVEDGLLRSRGLGAALVPPLSLVADDLGIYYDPARESRLERLIAAGPPPGGAARAAALRARLVSSGLSKYNLGGAALPDLPPGRRILVPGQVEDDASIRLGATGPVRSNLALLEAARAANPDAVILYKPHPDVEAGLRPGAIAPEAAGRLADAVLGGTDIVAALAAADEVWTITSAAGFEALLRGRAVVCLGAPFFAGWGLTRDLAPVPDRRRARPDIDALVHAVLIAYPRYRDPLTGLPCPAEVVLDRLAEGRGLPGTTALRWLARAQGALSSWPWLWRG